MDVVNILIVSVSLQWLFIIMLTRYVISLWDSHKEAAIAINAALDPIRRRNERKAQLKKHKEMYGKYDTPDRELNPPDNSAEDIVECVLCYRSVNIIAATELHNLTSEEHLCNRCENDIEFDTQEELEDEVKSQLEGREMFRKLRKHGI